MDQTGSASVRGAAGAGARPDSQSRKRAVDNNNNKSKSNLGRAASPPLVAENNYTTKCGYNQMPRIYPPPNCPFSFDDLHIHLIGPFLDWPHSPVTTPNGIQIQSAVLPQYILRGDRPTDRHTDQQMGLTTSLYQHPLTLYWLYSDASKSNNTNQLLFTHASLV